MANNEYKMKVSVEFNAQMSNINSQIDQLKDKITKLGSATGDKSLAAGLNKDIQEITTRLNGLRDMTITPANFNRFQAELQAANELIQKVQSSLNNIDVSNILKKIEEQKTKQINLNQEIAKEDSIIKELNDTSNRNDEQNKQLDEAIQKRKQLTQQLNGHKGAQKKLEKQLEATGLTQEEITRVLEAYGRAMQEAEKDGEKFKKGQEELENSKLAETIQNQVNRYIGLNAIYQYSKKYIRELVQTYKEFDESLVAIAAVTGQTRDQMWANIGIYNKMAQSLGVTTQEVINASKLYYQQGLTTTSVLKLTEETVKLATIAELDSADATEYLTTAMNGFKLSAEESTRVTDVWANLAAKTASDVDELAIAISKVASLAENAGMEIETASAFLNQMIETTREAPENLGTALKTIIARFQELKTSEEELSDGVDANKVERALKSAGVALRDSAGQFRDFDEVILELSSKWDSLDRNTQRYIATIAAGSRQQSRFIALVSDYEGLLRNVNYAYDSLGSADAQMAVFQEGLAASTNRLQAAWEGLYTSWSKSATVISKVIDGMADLVSTFGDIGAGASLVAVAFAGIGVSVMAQAAAYALNNQVQEQTVTTTKKIVDAKTQAVITENVETTSITMNTRSVAANTKDVALNTWETIKNTAARYAAIAPYVLLAAAIVGLTYAIVSGLNAQKEYVKQAEKSAQAARYSAAQEKDRASNIGVLIDELKQASNDEEKLLEVKQKVIDQFGEEIPGIYSVIDSYDNLIQKLEEYQAEKERIAAKGYVLTDQLQREADILAAGEAAGGKITKKYGNYNTANETVEVTTVYNLDGKTYTNIDDYAAAIAEKTGKVFDAGNYASGKSLTIKSFIDSDALEQDFALSEAIISQYYDSLADKTAIFDENNNFTEDFKNTVNDLNDEILNYYNTLNTVDQAKLQNLLTGSFENLSWDDIDNFIAQLPSEFTNGLESNKQLLQSNLKNFFNSLLTSGTLTDTVFTNLQQNLTVGAQKAFMDTFNSLKDDPAAQQSYIDLVTSLVGSMNPEDITGPMLESLGNLDLATQSFANLLDGLGNLKDESLRPYFEQLRDAIGETNATFEEGKATVDAYYDSMASLADLQKGGMSNEDYLAKLYDEAAALAGVTGADYNLVVAEMLKATTLDESGQMILQQTDLLKQWTDEQYISSAQTVEAKKAELLAYSASMEAIATELYALADEAEARELNTKGAVDNGDIVAKAANLLGQAEDEMGAAGKQAWSYVQGGKYTGAYQAVTKEAKDLSAQLEKLGKNATASDIRALANEAHARALTAASQAAQLSINKLANSFNKAGSGAGSAAKETDKLKDALEDLKEQLDEAKESAEAYMDAVIDKLEGERDAIEAAIEAEQNKLEKERDLLKIQLETWRDYIQERNDQAQDELQLQADAADMYFNQEIAAIQAKIDALDDEAEAEDRILKLQKARDEYNKAQNSRTRLVLTKGAGWVFKTDQNEIANAQKTLRDVQREIQKAEYQDQINALQEQATAWQEIADKIGESAAEAEKLAAALEQFRGAVESGDVYGDVDAFSQAVDNQQHLNDETTRLLEEAERWIEQAGWEYQDYLDDQARQGFLQEFQDGIVGENQLQENVTQYLENLLTNQAFIEAQQAILDKIQTVIDFYKEQKELLGLTDAELKAAEEMRNAIEESYDPTAENLGLGEDSKYFNANLLGLIEQIKKLAEQQAALEAQQKAAGTTSGSSSGSGGGSSGGGSTSYSNGITNYDSTDSESKSSNLFALKNAVKVGGKEGFTIPTISGSRGFATTATSNYKQLHNSTIFNIGTVTTRATDANEFVASFKQRSPITRGTGGVR